MSQKAGQAKISEPEPGPESALPLSLQSDNTEHSASPAAPCGGNIFAERTHSHLKSHKALPSVLGFVHGIAVVSPAAAPEPETGCPAPGEPLPLLIREAVKAPAPARELALAWKPLKAKDNLPLQGEREAIGRCIDSLDS